MANGWRLLWLMDNRIRETFPHAFAVTGFTVLEKLYRERKVPGRLRSAAFVLHERVIIPAVGFPNSKGDAGIYLGSETDHQRFWIRGEERTSNDNRLRFLFQIPNEQGSPTDRLFQEYARVYIGVGTPLPARR